MGDNPFLQGLLKEKPKTTEISNDSDIKDLYAEYGVQDSDIDDLFKEYGVSEPNKEIPGLHKPDLSKFTDQKPFSPSALLKDPVNQVKYDNPEAKETDALEIAKINAHQAKVNEWESKNYLQKSGNFIGDIGERLAAGVYDMGSMALKTPEFIQDVANLPYNVIMKSALKNGAEKAGMTPEQIAEIFKAYDKTWIQPAGFGQFTVGKNRALSNSAVNKKLEGWRDQLRKDSGRLDENTIQGYFKEGEYGKGVAKTVLGAVESLPITLSAAFTGTAGLTVIGGLTAAGQYDNLNETHPQMSDPLKVANAILYGTSESLTEIWGTKQIADMVKLSIQTAGKEVAEKQIKTGLSKVIQDTYKKAGLWIAPVHEGSSEWVNQVSQNAIAIATGEDPNRKLTEGAFDAFAIGALTGTGFTAVGELSKNTAKNRVQEQTIREAETQLQKVLHKKDGSVTTAMNGESPVYIIDNVDDKNVIVFDEATGKAEMISRTMLTEIESINPEQYRAEFINTALQAKTEQNIIKATEQVLTEQQENSQKATESLKKGNVVTFHGKELVVTDLGQESFLGVPQGGDPLSDAIEIPIAEYTAQFGQELSKNDKPTSDNASQVQPEPKTGVLGNSQIIYNENPDGSFHIPVKEGDDAAKLQKQVESEIDTEAFEVIPVTQEIPIENAAPFAKVKTRTVTTGMNIVPKTAITEDVKPKQDETNKQTATTEAGNIQESNTDEANKNLPEEEITPASINPKAKTVLTGEEVAKYDTKLPVYVHSIKDESGKEIGTVEFAKDKKTWTIKNITGEVDPEAVVSGLKSIAGEGTEVTNEFVPQEKPKEIPKPEEKQDDVLTSAITKLKDSESFNDLLGKIAPEEWAAINKKYNPGKKLTQQETYEAAINDNLSGKEEVKPESKPVKAVKFFDALKKNNAPRIQIQDQYGNEKTVFDPANKTDYFDKSDETGRKIRWGVELSDGRTVSLDGLLRITDPELWAKWESKLKGKSIADKNEFIIRHTMDSKQFEELLEDTWQFLSGEDVFSIRTSRDKNGNRVGEYEINAAKANKVLQDNGHPLAGMINYSSIKTNDGRSFNPIGWFLINHRGEEFPVGLDGEPLNKESKPVKTEVAKPEKEKPAKLTPEEKDTIHNSIVSQVRSYNSIPASYTNKRNEALKNIRNKAAILGYTLGNEGKKLAVYKDGKVIKTIARKIDKDEVDNHNALTDYNQETQDFMNKILDMGNDFVGLYLPEIATKEKKRAFDEIKSGKKSVVSNSVLDALERMYSLGMITLIDPTGQSVSIPIDDVFKSIQGFSSKLDDYSYIDFEFLFEKGLISKEERNELEQFSQRETQRNLSEDGIGNDEGDQGAAEEGSASKIITRVNVAEEIEIKKFETDLELINQLEVLDATEKFLNDLSDVPGPVSIPENGIRKTSINNLIGRGNTTINSPQDLARVKDVVSRLKAGIITEQQRRIDSPETGKFTYGGKSYDTIEALKADLRKVNLKRLPNPDDYPVMKAFEEVEKEIKVTSFKKGDGGTKGIFQGKDGKLYKSIVPTWKKFEDGKVVVVESKPDRNEYDILKSLQGESYVPKIGNLVETSEGPAFEIETLDEVTSLTLDEFHEIQDILKKLSDKFVYINDIISVMKRPETGEFVIIDFNIAKQGKEFEKEFFDRNSVTWRIEELLSESDKKKLESERKAAWETEKERRLKSLSEAKAKNLTPIQQTNLDKSLAEIDTQLEAEKAKIIKLEAGKGKELLKINNRNGLFGDIKGDPNDKMAGTFLVNQDTVKKALKKFDEDIAEAKKEITRLEKLRKDTIESARDQGEMSFDEVSDVERPIGIESQIDDVLGGQSESDKKKVTEKIQYATENVNSIEKINDAKVYNVIVDGNNLRYNLKNTGKNTDQKYYYPVQYAKIEYKKPDIKVPTKMAGDLVKPKTPADKISDFGEKISGAKKDRIADIVKKMKDSTMDDIIKNPLSKVFPEPDYDAMIKEGLITSSQASGMKVLREQIPPKPRRTYRVEQWAKTVKSFMDNYTDLMERKGLFADGMSFGDFVEAGIKKYPGSAQAFTLMKYKFGFYEFAGYNYNASKYDIRAFNNESGKEIAIVSSQRIFGRFKTEQEAYEALKKRIDAEVEKANNGEKESKLSVYEDRKTSEIFIGYKGTQVIRLKSGFENYTDARKYIAENRAELEQILQSYKNIPNERKATNSERIGTDYRNGKDVTPEQFAQTFGFRGTQFGNYVENERRQQDLNEAYDSLMDLSNLLNIPPRAISLNGELGLAFGARGSGKFSAHYESGQVVINLTKTRGAGSLAHEWWHALDSYFSRNRGRKDAFLSDAPYPVIDRNGVKPDPTRPELIDAFKNLVRTIDKTGLPKRSGKLDAARTKRYWDTTVEKTARAFEWYIKTRLEANGAQNDYLANITEEDVWAAEERLLMRVENSYPYPTKSEADVITKAYDELFTTIQHKTGENGNVIMLRRGSISDGMGMSDRLDARIMQIQNTFKNKGFDINFKNGVEITKGGKNVQDIPGSLMDLATEYDDIIWFKQNAKYRRGGTMGLYSNAEEALTKINQNKATPEQWTAMILNNGGKQGELDWMGWDEFIKDKKSITKDEVSEFIAQNKVGLKESVLGGPSEEEINTFLNDEAGEGFSRQEAIDYLENDEDSPKFSQYTLPGGTNYKEWLLTMPEAVKPLDKWGYYKSKGFEKDGFEALSQAEQTRLFNEWKEYFSEDSYVGKSSFKSSHFDQPNIVVHVRSNERMVDGKKVLFIEEVQSDWAQKGKKEGFKGDKPKFTVEYVGNSGVRLLADGNVIDQSTMDRFNSLFNGDESYYIESFKDAVQNTKNRYAVPSMPFRQTDQWVKLAIRRMLIHASENGFDAIAWTTGSVQAERYDLSKQVRRLSIGKQKDGTYDIDAVRSGDENDQAWTKIATDVPENKIEDYVGKEIAKSVIETGQVLYEGTDLKVGGTGMIAFYDQIIPSIVNKEVKRFGVKTAISQIDTKPDLTEEGIDTQTGEVDKPTTGKYAEVHSIPITPEMKQSVLQGLPMFKIIGETGARNLDKAQEATTRMDNLAVAREMEANGKDAKTIRLATGWERGVDKKWRYEINDIKQYRGVDKALFSEAVRAQSEIDKLNENKDYDTDRKNYINAITKLYDSLGYSLYNREISQSINKALKENNPDILPISTFTARIITFSKIRNYNMAKLSDVIEHGELFKAYPELKEVNVEFVDGMDSQASYNSATNTIALNGLIKGMEPDVKSALSHEIQHAIQGIEGFAKGGNSEMFGDKIGSIKKEYQSLYQEYTTKKLALEKGVKVDGEYDISYDGLLFKSKELAFDVSRLQNKIESLKSVEKANWLSPYEAYRRLSGEVQSRNVQSRLNFTDKQRRETLLSETEDVAREDQIFINDSLNPLMQSAGKPKTAGELLKQNKLSAVEQKRIHDKLNKLIEKMNANIIVVKKQTDLPGWIQRRIGDEPIHGVNIGKTSYIILENQENERVALMTVLHEAGVHGGIKNLIPNEFEREQLFNQIFEDIGLDEIRKTVLPDYVTEFRAGRMTKAQLAEEYMAYIAEKRLDPDKVLTEIEQSIWDKFIAKINDLLKRIFNFDHKITEDDVLAIAKAAIQTNFQNGQSDTSDGRGVYDREVQQREYKDNNPQNVNDAGIRFAGDLLTQPMRKANVKPDPTIPQTSTPAFKAWFGNSVVTVDGKPGSEPLVVYHGTRSIFNVFKPSEKIGNQKEDDQITGMYFTDNKEGASFFSLLDNADYLKNVYLSIQNPYITRGNNSLKEELGIENLSDAKDRLISMGHDGIILEKGFYAKGGPHKAFIVFSPTQIKSATGNQGTFDPGNGDIRMKRGNPIADIEEISEQSGKGKPPMAGDLMQTTEGMGENPPRKPDRMIKTTADWLKMQFSNKLQSVWNFQETIKKLGGKIRDYSDIHSKENLYHGRVYERMQKDAKEFVEPLFEATVKLTKEAKATDQERIKYMIAKHTPERTETFISREIDKFIKQYNDDSGQLELFDGSTELEFQIQKLREKLQGQIWTGMSVDEANKIVEEFESKVSDKAIIDNFWKLKNDLSRQTLDYWLEYEQITENTYKDLIHTWQYYVPLRGWAEMENNVFDYDKTSGDFLNTIQPMKGRTSIAADPMPYLANMLNTAIIIGEKNRVSQSALRLVQDNLGVLDGRAGVTIVYDVDTGLTDDAGNKIYEPTTIRPDAKMFADNRVKTTISTDPTKFSKPPQLAKQHHVEAYFNGQKYSAWFEDPSVSRAINNKISESITAFSSVLNSGVPIKLPTGKDGDLEFTIPMPNQLTREMAKMFTQLNPNFIAVNAVRDLPVAMITEWVEGDIGDAMEFLKYYKRVQPTMVRAMFNKLDKNNELDAMFNDWIMEGGRTGIVVAMDLEKIKSKLNRQLRMYSRMDNRFGKYLTSPAKVYKYTVKALEATNSYAEGMTRFATYVKHVKAGESKQRAAIASQNVTVNFTKKGNASALFGGFYAFFNACVQATSKFYGLHKTNYKKMLALEASLITMGYVVAAITDMIGGDDDEEKEEGNTMKVNSYDSHYDFDKYNNIIIPGTDIKVPISQGFRAFYAIGAIAYETQRNITLGRKDVEDAIGEGLLKVLSNAPNDFSPWDASGFFNRDGEFQFRPVIPTWFIPPYDLITNTDFTGRMIYREPFTLEDKQRKANSQLYFNNTNKLLVKATDAIYKGGGGDESGYKTYYKNGELKHIRPVRDLNPAWFEHLFEGYFGGTGKFFNDSYKVTAAALEGISNTLNDKPFMDAMTQLDVRNIPVIQRFVASSSRDVEYELFRSDKKLQKEYEGLLNQYKRLGSVDKTIEMAMDFDNVKATILLKYSEVIDQLSSEIATEKNQVIADSLRMQRTESIRECRAMIEDMRKSFETK
jgi:hypothetical protein